jgi:uncharacterized membrane protein
LLIHFSVPDFVAVVVFVLSWGFYSIALAWTSRNRASLDERMNDYRYHWLIQAARLDVRMPDVNINASLQNGTAFFASTSLLAMGGAISLFPVVDDIISLLGALPVIGETASRTAVEFKIIGLAVIFTYAFFKFSWSYRLFNFSAILIGTMPPNSAPEEEIERAAMRAAKMNVAASREYNRGQRALSFSLAYLGWFISPIVFMVATVVVLVNLLARQYRTKARAIVAREEGEIQVNPFTHCAS